MILRVFFLAPIFIDTSFRSFAYSFPVRVSVRIVRAAFVSLFEVLHGLPSYFAQFHFPSVAMRAVVASPCDALEVGMGSLVGPKIPKEHLHVEGFVLRVVPKQ